MKFADTVVSIIIMAAVLLSAYAVGLVIREVRTSAVAPQPQVVAEANDVAAEPEIAALAGRSAEQTTDVPTLAVAVNEPMQTAAKADQSSPKKDKPFRDGAYRRADGRRGGNALRALSPQAREQMRQRWESMSDEQRQEFKARMQSRSGTARSPRRNNVSQETADTEQDAGESDSEPDRDNQD